MIQELTDSFSALTVFQVTVLAIALLLWLLRFLYLLLFPLRVVSNKNKAEENDKNTSLSILLTVRNEENNIRETFPSLLTVEGADYEVVAVDDFSQDNTLSVLGLLKQRYEKLKISSLSQETRHSEKLSQNIALKLASKEWALIYPINAQKVSEEWLAEMCKSSDDTTSVKVGYVTVLRAKSWFNKLYRVENFFQQVKSASFILNGAAFVYNEENVAFKRTEYFNHGGYGVKVNEPFANLELVLNDIITKKNSEFNFSDKSVVEKQFSVGQSDFTNLIRKSIRIEKYLSNRKKFLLEIDRLTEIFYPLFVVFSLFVALTIWPVILTFILLKLLVFMVIIKILQNRLNEHKLFITSLVFSFIRPFYRLIFKWRFNRTSRNYKWKNKG
ncbi:glycosyltransferase [Draconibacterium sp. IB214405]|uniref:glycosyltransferase n=1 Tax=Draconibacterium sp. IB214405 TaxID=3097352 RepID=UPI002A17F552|nr:glycosyltransferase [Draconibacterium sp. IB214405]MDX8340851.1 glycosyltransferase [Draconibacterium sp. IB214405]